MSESDAEHVKQHVKVYLMVFAALGVLTVVTVAISYLDLPTSYAIAVAIAVASVKASLVAAYFMHLVSEEKVIYYLLALCAAFFITLMLVPLATETGTGPLWPL
ncbi:MAG: cytochrome C oxidase subunit IV family protein [Myxococcales bacterium]|nr:cytochrome C oxidase subunit IV family protein [Myxococcales bacterium]